MRKMLIYFAIPALVGGAAMTAATATDSRPGPLAREQARVASDLARLTPQPDVDCIDTRRNDGSLRAVGRQLIYRQNRNTIFVSNTAGGCEGVARGDVLVTRQFGTRLCQGDIAQTVDRTVGFPTGSCAIGRFTPYTKR